MDKKVLRFGFALIYLGHVASAVAQVQRGYGQTDPTTGSREDREANASAKKPPGYGQVDPQVRGSDGRQFTLSKALKQPNTADKKADFGGHGPDKRAMKDSDVHSVGEWNKKIIGPQYDEAVSGPWGSEPPPPPPPKQPPPPPSPPPAPKSN